MDENRTQTETVPPDDDPGDPGEVEVKCAVQSDQVMCQVIKCARCNFWCSDSRYIKLHREVDQCTNPEADVENHPAWKNFKSQELQKDEESNSGNVEDIIKIAHKLLGHLYGLLLDSKTEPLNTTNNTTPTTTLSDQAKQAAQLIANLQSPTPEVATPPKPIVEPMLNIRKRKRPSEEVTKVIDAVDPTPEPTNPMFGLQSLLAKRQPAFGNGLLNLSPSTTTQSPVADQIDRTQLLFETIRAAQAAQKQTDEEPPDAVVNPQEPNEDKKEDDEDEIEIIHMATDDTPQGDLVKQEALTFPSSDTLSRSNSMAPFYSRNILTQIQQKKGQAGSATGMQSPLSGFDSPKPKAMDSISSYSLATFAQLSQNANGSFNGTNNATSQNNVSKTPISCSICGSHWRTPSALNIHMRVHTGEKPYKCYVCGKGHKQKGQLKVHMNKHHPGRWFGGQVYCKDPKKCSMCGEVFNDPKDLSKHILECAPNGVAPKLLGINGPGTGGGGAKLTCEICGAYFTSQASYKRHLESCRLSHAVNKQLAASSSPQTTPPETPRLSDFNSNQNSSVNSIAESLLARLKTNSALLQYGRIAAQAQANHANTLATNQPVDFSALAANLIQNQTVAARHVSSDSVSNSSHSTAEGLKPDEKPIEKPTLELGLPDKGQLMA